ncbi:MAG TPA: hypothetical protein VFJ16_02140 [Longimicrobium sp.]|nr:hypothetical protein [Longimicrobium sp.]
MTSAARNAPLASAVPILARTITRAVAMRKEKRFFVDLVAACSHRSTSTSGCRLGMR